MNCIIKGHKLIYHVQTLIQIFFHNEKFNLSDNVSKDGITVYSEVYKNKIIISKIFLNGKMEIQSEEENFKDLNYTIKKSLYLILLKFTGEQKKWGMLTGIRPAKIARELFDKNFKEEEVIKIFTEKYFSSKDKALLAIEVAKKEISILSKCDKRKISLYIGIPFCPSKCFYCSFPSYNIKKYSKNNIVDLYVDKLIEELCWIKENVKEDIESIYIGGGTPTSLDEKNLEKLLNGIKENINMTKVIEYTVEAGRPDTLNFEKLNIIKNSHATRISINPQTMKDETLKLIGRSHNVKDFTNMFNMAREIGFNNINVDLIFGLPNESVNDIKNTLEKINELNPENITIHTLAIKTGSKFKDELEKNDFQVMEQIEKMLEISNEFCKHNGYKPYYMYRQKNMIGNFENVGYEKNNTECIYNIQMMEEEQSVLAIGVGAVSKWVNTSQNKIERVFNFKSIEEYLKRFDEVIERKKIFKTKGES